MARNIALLLSNPKIRMGFVFVAVQVLVYRTHVVLVLPLGFAIDVGLAALQSYAKENSNLRNDRNARVLTHLLLL